MLCNMIIVSFAFWLNLRPEDLEDIAEDRHMAGRVYDNILSLSSIKPNAVGIVDYTPVEEVAAKYES